MGKSRSQQGVATLLIDRDRAARGDLETTPPASRRIQLCSPRRDVHWAVEMIELMARDAA
jgi:hypothetical protein